MGTTEVESLDEQRPPVVFGNKKRLFEVPWSRLGIYLLCQVIPVDLWTARTSAHRR